MSAQCKWKKEESSYIEELADKLSDEGLKNIFLNLVNEEVKHCELFKNIAKSEDHIKIPKMDVTKDAKEIFAEMKASGKELNFGDDQIALYKKALESENKAYNLYIDKANEVSNPEHKEICS